jgi:hypothetical protein
LLSPEILPVDSAPAVARKRHDGPRERRRLPTKIDRRGRLWRRIAELAKLYTDALGADLTQLQREKVAHAAQLKAIAEQARGEWMRSGKGTLDDIVRCERNGRARLGAALALFRGGFQRLVANLGAGAAHRRIVAAEVAVGEAERGRYSLRWAGARIQPADGVGPAFRQTRGRNELFMRR